MSIEALPTSHAAAKPAQPAAGSKSVAASNGATATAAGDALGFLAMLSAADDALALSAAPAESTDDSTSLPASLVPDDGELLLARDADASALAGWLLGVPVPTAPDAAPRGAAARANGAGSAPDTGAFGTSLLAGRKSGKLAGTSELQLQQIQNPQVAAALPQQGHEDVTQQLPDVRAVQVPELAPAPVLEGKELTFVSAAVSVGDRHAQPVAEAKVVLAEGGYFQSQASSAPMGMDGVVATQSAAPLEAYVAEQVSYWISQDVQNAELTLDGMGFSPVEVSISMQGNEAHVAFRTDELHARDAIQNASEQLRDSLQRQGVMLTGMSVGTSDSGDATGQGRRQRQDGRPGVATAVVPVQVDSAVRSTGTQGRAIDLFV